MAALPAQTAKILDFIRAAKERGLSDDLILRLLDHRGWPERQVDEAWAAWLEQDHGLTVPERESRRGEGPRDALALLVAYSTLGTWAWAIGDIFFTFIQRAFPPPDFGYTPLLSLLAGDLAAVIVAFPIFLAVSHFLQRDLQQHPEKASSGIRRWLTSIMLLLAAIALVADLITFVQTLLSGGLTVPFVLKVLTVLVIAGGIFGYYVPVLRTRKEAAGE